MIPSKRLVLYQGCPETIEISFEENGAAEAFEAGATVVFTARLPRATTDAFTITCSFVGAVLSVPFTADKLATAANYDYSIKETPSGGTPRLRLQGLVAMGAGLEVVATV